jgi:hydrogenase expression/formation protein HypC
MCLAVPGKIIEIDTSNVDLKMAKVSFGGIIKNICIEWLPDTVEGDYILAHAGTALNKIDAMDAEATLQIFDQWTQGLENENK